MSLATQSQIPSNLQHDLVLSRHIAQALVDEGYQFERISVHVHGRTVELIGVVPNAQARATAERIVLAQGVDEVFNRLRLDPTLASHSVRPVSLRMPEYSPIAWSFLLLGGFLLLAPLLTSAMARLPGDVVVVRNLATHAVTWPILCDGQPAVGATVTLHRVAGPESPSPVEPRGVVDASGVVRFTTYRARDGVPVGEYIATIDHRLPGTREGRPGPSLIDEQFRNRNSSPIRVTISGWESSLDPLQLNATTSGADPTPVGPRTTPERTDLSR